MKSLIEHVQTVLHEDTVLHEGTAHDLMVHDMDKLEFLINIVNPSVGGHFSSTKNIVVSVKNAKGRDIVKMVKSQNALRKVIKKADFEKVLSIMNGIGGFKQSSYDWTKTFDFSDPKAFTTALDKLLKA